MGIVPFEYIDKVIKVIQKTPRHTYMILTKRPHRMKEYFCEWLQDYETLPNLYLGVSCENQATADERIPLLLQTPAAVRFVSAEPLLSEIDLSEYLHCGISWCIIGAESGPSARPMNEDWVRRLITQCKQNQVSVFYKQKIVGGKKISLPMLDGKRYTKFPQTIDRQSES